MTQRYTISKKIGEGGFGKVYLAHDNVLKHNVALKEESNTAVGAHAQLKHEHEIYKRLGTTHAGIARVFDYHESKSENKTMSMQVLGPNLEERFEKNKRTFSLKTVLMIADSILHTLEFIHSKGLVHKDIKPENIVTDVNTDVNKQLYLIDFGLTSFYVDIENNDAHINWAQNNVSIDGTARYAGINAHFGIIQSRRDDLESLGFVLIYFLKGKLPWQGLHSVKNKYEHICDIKCGTSIEELCKCVDPVFAAYLTYVRDLLFDASPDYKLLRKWFRQAAINKGNAFDDNFDWILSSRNKRQAKSANAATSAPTVSKKGNIKAKWLMP